MQTEPFLQLRHGGAWRYLTPTAMPRPPNRSPVQLTEEPLAPVLARSRPLSRVIRAPVPVPAFMSGPVGTKGVSATYRHATGLPYPRHGPLSLYVSPPSASPNGRAQLQRPWGPGGTADTTTAGRGCGPPPHGHFIACDMIMAPLPAHL